MDESSPLPEAQKPSRKLSIRCFFKLILVAGLFLGAIYSTYVITLKYFSGKMIPLPYYPKVLSCTSCKGSFGVESLNQRRNLRNIYLKRELTTNLYSECCAYGGAEIGATQGMAPALSKYFVSDVYYRTLLLTFRSKVLMTGYS